jgi:hypothetical protein
MNEGKDRQTFFHMGGFRGHSKMVPVVPGMNRPDSVMPLYPSIGLNSFPKVDRGGKNNQGGVCEVIVHKFWKKNER